LVESERGKVAHMRKSAAAVAAEYLKSRGLDGIGHGDSVLLHEVADLIGVPHNGPKTERLVLNRIDRSHKGVLVKLIVSLPERGLGRIRMFKLIASDPHADPGLGVVRGKPGREQR
jgi:hypothetical protein